jgi:phage baseplate assembly protein V
MNISELLRRLNNLISIGTISETKSSEGKALARVKIFDRVTDFYPVVSFSNTFKRHFIPIRVNEQVLVFSPYGDASSGFIIRGIFNRGRKEHSLSNDHTEVIDFEDGTVITYDTEAKELKIDAVNKITVICKSANVKADDVKVEAQTLDITATTSNTGNVKINGSLTVTDAIVGQGGLAVSGGNGASINGDIKTTGNISDSKGDLTDHGHNDSDGGSSNPR